MRWVAKNVVAAKLASRCEVQVAYAIGKAEPVGLFVETFGTETVPVTKIVDAINEDFDLRPAAIIRDLDLKRPIYRRPPRTATSAARTPTSPGSAPTGPSSWPSSPRADCFFTVAFRGPNVHSPPACWWNVRAAKCVWGAAWIGNVGGGW